MQLMTRSAHLLLWAVLGLNIVQLKDV